MKKIFVLFTLIIVSLCTIVAQDLTQDQINKMSKKKKFKTEELQGVSDDDLMKVGAAIDYKNWKPRVQIYSVLIERHPTDNRYYYWRCTAYHMGQQWKEAQRDALYAYELYTRGENQEIPMKCAECTEEAYLHGLDMLVESAEQMTHLRDQMRAEIVSAIGEGVVSVTTGVSNIVNITSNNQQEANSSDNGEGTQSSNKKKKWVSCDTCKGTGVCRNCGGTGKYSFTKDGKCHECRPVGTGKCGTCKGKKGSYV